MRVHVRVHVRVCASTSAHAHTLHEHMQLRVLKNYHISWGKEEDTKQCRLSMRS